MRYGIFSDIHGNIPAFKAALADAEAQGVTGYLMIGDYYGHLPWGNEVTETLRGLDSAVVIRGNHEGYLLDLQKQNQSTWNMEQFKLKYWHFRSLTQKNMEFLTSLPESAVVSDNGIKIFLEHSSSIFFRVPQINAFHSTPFRTLMEKSPFSHEEYLVFAREALLSRSEVLEEINGLMDGVYLFGHNHLQFHTEYEGKLFVNPGSCGVALDCDTTAAYTILECFGGGWEVTERRVEYDVDAAVAGLRGSGLAVEAPVWSGVIERQVLTGKDYFGIFLSHIGEIGRKLGQPKPLISNEIWDIAIETWDAEKC